MSVDVLCARYSTSASLYKSSRLRRRILLSAPSTRYGLMPSARKRPKMHDVFHSLIEEMPNSAELWRNKRDKVLNDITIILTLFCNLIILTSWWPYCTHLIIFFNIHLFHIHSSRWSTPEGLKSAYIYMWVARSTTAPWTLLSDLITLTRLQWPNYVTLLLWLCCVPLLHSIYYDDPVM